MYHPKAKSCKNIFQKNQTEKQEAGIAAPIFYKTDAKPN